jgi:sterol desaturase/sphingolipid hydroxylase (fatty acid hydroxylase superfamily)
MESYVSFNDLLLHHASPVILVFVPIFLATTVLEGLLILYRQGTYPWKNAGVSTVMAVGHFLTQAAAHGLIFGIIAASVYRIRVATVPVSLDHWLSLIVLFLLTDLAFYIEHRCSHRIRLLWRRTACITAVR